MDYTEAYSVYQDQSREAASVCVCVCVCVVASPLCGWLCVCVCVCVIYVCVGVMCVGRVEQMAACKYSVSALVRANAPYMPPLSCYLHKRSNMYVFRSLARTLTHTGQTEGQRPQAL